MKYIKQSQIQNINDDKSYKDNDIDIPRDDTLSDDELDPKYLNNLRHLSEERWRNINWNYIYIKLTTTSLIFVWNLWI